MRDDDPMFLQVLCASARQFSTSCSGNRSLDSLTAARISFAVALVLIPETSNGDFLLFLKIMEKVSRLSF